MNRFVSRRNFLRGAGVAITLPWLESLAPKEALAQAASRLRYMPIFIPNGAAEAWRPPTAGAGAAWQLSGVLQPLEMFKSKMIVLSGIENGTSFNPDGSSSVEPSHGRQPAGWLTCQDPRVGGPAANRTEGNNPSIDQLMTKDTRVVGATPVKSLQVGLSTWFSNCDANPCSNSRSISWSLDNMPMYKVVDPLEVFTKLSGVVAPSPGGGPVMPDPELVKRVARNKSVLDAVKENATRTLGRLGTADRLKVDQFLTHVRAVEKQATTVSAGMGGLACTLIPRPTTGMILPDSPKQNNATYNKGTHADIMNELIVMAFQCDATRVVTYMMEDERSEFAYGHVPRRTFTATGSMAGAGSCGEYHNNGQHGTQDEFATINWWNVGKVAALCAKLDAIKEGDKSILDNTVMMFGGAMHGSNHACNMLPLALIGGGGGKLKTDQHLVLTNRWMRDLHVTMMKSVFGMTIPEVNTFGAVRADKPVLPVTEILVA